VASPHESSSLGIRYHEWPRVQQDIFEEAKSTYYNLKPIDANDTEAEKAFKELSDRRTEERKNASKAAVAAYRWASNLHERYDTHVSDHLDTAVNKCINFV